MSIFKARVLEFENALAKDEIDLKHLRQLCSNGIPDVNSLRSQCWKILLGYLSTQRESWSSTLAQKRELYREFIEEFVLPPDLKENGSVNKEVCLSDHPLSEGPDSAWNTFFNDNELLFRIDKDLRQLCPDISFFQQPTEYPCDIVVNSRGERRLHQRVVPSVLKSANVERKGLGVTKINFITKRSEETYKAMDEGQEAHWEVVQRIVFINAKLNPGQGFVQGMNEIVGPIYYVMASDPDQELRKHAEADCFYCITTLMAEIRDFLIKILNDSEGGIKNTIKRVSELFRIKDLQIHERLKVQELHPQYYSFRWVSVMLAQELPLPDVVRIWDSVLSDENRSDFLLKISCGMMLYPS